MSDRGDRSVVPVEAPALRWLAVWRAIGIALCALVVYLSLRSEPAPLAGGHGSRVDHLLAYAVLMSWHCQLHEVPRARAAWALGLFVMGVALEFLQRLTEFRTFSVIDMIANAGGVVLGWLAAPPRAPNLLRRIEARWLR